MNYFTKKRMITLAIIALIIVNITCYGLPFGLINIVPLLPGVNYELPEDAKAATTFFLKQELQFSDEQVEKFLAMQDSFLKENHDLQRQIGDCHKELYQSIIKNTEVNEAELYAKVGELTSLKEEKTVSYFKELKQLCTPRQQKKIDMLIGQILMRIDPMHLPKGRQAKDRMPGQNRPFPPGQMPPRMHDQGVQ